MDCTLRSAPCVRTAARHAYKRYLRDRSGKSKLTNTIHRIKEIPVKKLIIIRLLLGALTFGLMSAPAVQAQGGCPTQLPVSHDYTVVEAVELTAATPESRQSRPHTTSLRLR